MTADAPNTGDYREQRFGKPMADLLVRVERMVGRVPVGTVDLLNVLAHPDAIGLTRAFLDSKDEAQDSGSPEAGR